MAFNPAPSNWLPNWSEDGTEITVPISTFPELTAAEADGATGDIRKVAFALCEKLVAAWNATPVADRPARLQIGKSQSLNANGQITANFSFTFTLTPGLVEVSPE